MKPMSTLIAHKGSTSQLWKWIGYILYAYFITFPFVIYNGFLYGGSSTRSISLIAVSIIISTLFVLWSSRKGAEVSIPRSYIGLSLVVYFVAIVISGLAGIDPHATFWSAATRTTGIWYLVHLSIAVFLLAGVISERSTHRRMVFAIIVSTALYSLLALFGPEGIGLMFGNFIIDGFTFGNSSFAGMYLFGAFILALYYLFSAETKRWWMYVLPVALIINPYILSKGIWSGDFSSWVGEARSSAYAIVFSIVALVVLWGVSKIRSGEARSKAAYGLFGLSILVALLSAWSLFSHDGYLRGVYLSQATAARPLIWEMSEKAIAERPVLGWGGDTFESVFEQKYDNRLLQEEYGNEAWFDRAHNAFIDQAVDGGIVGLLSYLAVYIVTALMLMRVVLKSSDRDDRLLASFLIVYVALHLAELQTAFDTSISYPLVAFMLASAIVLEHRLSASGGKKREERSVWVMNASTKHIFAGTVLVFSCWSLFWGWLPFVRAQIANGQIRTAGSPDKRLPLYPALFGSPVDEHSFLWRTSTDFQRGIGSNPHVLTDKAFIDGLKEEIQLFEREYRNYIEENPMHFRAHLNLADILIYERLFGVDKLTDAQSILDRAIELVPQAPQAYWMKAVAAVYQGDFEHARRYAQMGLDLNPNIVQSRDIVQYVETSIKNFPEIDLFFFRQI